MDSHLYRVSPRTSKAKTADSERPRVMYFLWSGSFELTSNSAAEVPSAVASAARFRSLPLASEASAASH